MPVFSLKLLVGVLWLLTLDGASAQRNTCSAGPASIGANCIHRQRAPYASAYCSSVLAISTPTSAKTITTLDTILQTSTATRTATHIGKPPVTTTISGTTTINSTTTLTETSTTVSGTFITYVGMTTITSTTFSNVYTCAGKRSASSVSASSFLSLSGSPSITIGSSSSSLLSSTSAFSSSSDPRSFSTNSASASSTPMISSSVMTSALPSASISWSIIVTGTGISPPGGSFSASASPPPFLNSSSVSVWSSAKWPSFTSTPASISAPTSIPYYGPALAKRQTATAPIFYSPRCLRRYSKTYGDSGITNACDCLDIATPSPVTTTITTVDPKTTVTSTTTIQVNTTTTKIPTTTATAYSTSTKSFSTTTTITEMRETTLSQTSTVTSVTTSVVTQSYPTPTSFNIYYIDSSSNATSPPAQFFEAIEAPGGSGIVLAPEAAADSFMLDSQGRLVDTTGGDSFIAKNTDDLYPFELLQTTAATANIPTCSACDGVLQCNYPGTKGNTFALCYGYLALGPPDVFGKDSNHDGHVDCVPITLRFT